MDQTELSRVEREPLPIMLVNTVAWKGVPDVDANLVDEYIVTYR